MAIDITIGGSARRLQPKDLLGEGGEAEIYRLPYGLVAKIFKSPAHLSFEGDRDAQQAAIARIEEHQSKLAAFPKGLPARVIAPSELIYDVSRTKVLGYTMPFLSGAEVLLKYCERKFRETRGITDDRITRMFAELYGLVDGVHRAHVVIGDFNDLNVMIDPQDAVHLIDADSMQFGRFVSRVFTARFVDPLLCEFSSGGPMLRKPHNEDSDRYAYAVMLMQGLLYAGPYAGVHIPKPGQKRLSDGQRLANRMTVFSDEVRFPKAARHYSVLPQDILHFFEETFVKNERKPVPMKLIEAIHFTTCPSCGKEHARTSCPDCQPMADIAVKEIVTGSVEATKILDTFGHVLHACIQGGLPKFVYHEQGGYYREGALRVIPGALEPSFRIRISGTHTVIAKSDAVVILDAMGKPEHRIAVDRYRGKIPALASSGRYVFAAEGGHLRRYGGLLGMQNPEPMGEVLEGQTLLWAGDKLGLVFYQAGEIMRAHVFNVERTSLGAEIRIPKLRGVIIDAAATFSSEYCWFFITTDDRGTLRNRVFMLRQDGTIEGEAEAVRGDGSWLEHIHGFCATSKFLFAPTDDGIARIECPQGGTLSVTKSYVDTVRFVNSGTKLLLGNDGIYAVSTKNIWRLRIK